MNDRRREPSTAEIKADNELRYKKSLAYAAEQARARLAAKNNDSIRQADMQKIAALQASIDHLLNLLNKTY